MDVEQFIRDNHIQMSDKELSKHVNYCHSYVNKLRNRLGLKSTRSNSKVYILTRSAKCYELWIKGITIVDIARQVTCCPSHVSKMVGRFFPYRGDNKITITLQSKINGN